MRGLEEQGIIVAAKQTIEGSQLWWSQRVDIPWCNMSVLPSNWAVSLDPLVTGHGLEMDTDNIVGDTKQQLLEYQAGALVRFDEVTPIFWRS